jgi:hypothetical protein
MQVSPGAVTIPDYPDDPVPYVVTEAAIYVARHISAVPPKDADQFCPTSATFLTAHDGTTWWEWADDEDFERAEGVRFADNEFPSFAAAFADWERQVREGVAEHLRSFYSYPPDDHWCHSVDQETLWGLYHDVKLAGGDAEAAVRADYLSWPDDWKMHPEPWTLNREQLIALRAVFEAEMETSAAD